ncbi:hypothetical protein [Streptomyces sp. AP-93]|uniref:hypothetical protein n=1 Tax=Streptomyces sp. AP-93 TaxID=2929048 RepID=UPI001FAE993D|nr:hypothetical protein [Streptomyces sp. AP-93]MCJ0875223.1 hypothetical protein [Streptomyces sp. AP-93]
MDDQRRPLGTGPRQAPAPDGPARRGRLAAELADPTPEVPAAGEPAPEAAVRPPLRILGTGSART